MSAAGAAAIGENGSENGMAAAASGSIGISGAGGGVA